MLFTDKLIPVLPRQTVPAILTEKEKITQVVLRTDAPSSAYIEGRAFFIGEKSLDNLQSDAVILSRAELDGFFERLCRGSVYAYSEQIKNGYITAAGGHRVGLSGTAVVKNGEIIGMKSIGAYTVRIAHEIMGCAAGIYGTVYSDGKIKNTLIVSPPGCGKTTALRDLCGYFSNIGKRVCVIDERSELVAAENGVSPFKSCKLCSFIDGIPKAEGIGRAVRALSPEVVIFDELGSDSEAESVVSSMKCGVSFIFSVHAANISEALSRRAVKTIVSGGALDLCVSLDENHCVGEIYLFNGSGK